MSPKVLGLKTKRGIQILQLLNIHLILLLYIRSCVYVENGAFYGMGYFPSDATVSDLSELKEYIDRYKSSHYIMKLIASFAARHPGKVKPIKKSIAPNAANFENFD